MKILYDSRTGNVERFINKIKTLTGWTFEKITKDTVIDSNVHFVTYTTGLGHVPNLTKSFLEKNNQFVQSVSVSGNRNWGTNFGKSGDIITDQYNIPLLIKFELSGNESEMSEFIKQINNFS